MTEANVENPAVGEQVDEILQGLLARITTAKDAKSYLKMLIYSDPGGRKSTFVGTAPNSLIVDTEDGLTSLKNHPEIVDLDKVDVLPFKSFYQVEMLVDRMAKGVPQFAKYEVLGIDTVSELHKRGLAEVTERQFALGTNANRYSAEGSDQGENNEHIRRLVASLRDLDRHIILTAHARTVENKDKSHKIYPDFSEKLANTIAGQVDVVAYIEKREINNKICAVWHCESDGYVTAKNRIGLPMELVDPTWSTFMEYFDKHNATSKPSNTLNIVQ